MFPDEWDFCEYVTLQPIIVSSNLITVIINLSAHITSFKKVAHSCPLIVSEHATRIVVGE